MWPHACPNSQLYLVSTWKNNGIDRVIHTYHTTPLSRIILLCHWLRGDLACLNENFTHLVGLAGIIEDKYSESVVARVVLANN